MLANYTLQVQYNNDARVRVKMSVNSKIWGEINKYRSLGVGGKRVVAPYYMNLAGLKTLGILRKCGMTEGEIREAFETYSSDMSLYGWRRGKGTPLELEEGVRRIADALNVDLSQATEKGVLMMMYDYGLGVDCSGFVFNVLHSVYGKRLIEILNWGRDNRHDVFRAGVFVFAGGASEVIGPNDVGAGDLILLKTNGKYTHVALIVERGGVKFVAQSTSVLWPMGVHVHEMTIAGGKPEFGFVPEWGKGWEEKWGLGEVEFRRLKLPA